MYGNKVTSLGFLMHDPECLYVAPPEPEPEEEPEPIVEITSSLNVDEDDGLGAGAITGIILAVIALLVGLSVGGFYGWKKYKLRQGMAS